MWEEEREGKVEKREGKEEEGRGKKGEGWGGERGRKEEKEPA